MAQGKIELPTRGSEVYSKVIRKLVTRKPIHSCVQNPKSPFAVWGSEFWLQHERNFWQDLQLLGSTYVVQYREGDTRKRQAVGIDLENAQKVPGWSETVKRLGDEDTRKRVPLEVVILGPAPLGALRRGQLDCDVDLSRRAAAHAGGQAGVAAAAVRARLPLLRAGALVHKDAGPATGRREHDHAGSLSGAIGRCRTRRWASEVRRRRSAQPGLEPEAASAQYGIAHCSIGVDAD